VKLLYLYLGKYHYPLLSLVSRTVYRVVTKYVPPCPEEISIVSTKCMMNFERYTKYNSFELIIAILRRVWAAWQAILNLPVNSSEMAKID